jgi:hypothetical protein
MSDHAWILENLAAYLTGGLEAAERERLEQHVTECAPCAAALSEARALDGALSGLFVETRPSGVLEDRVIQKLRTQPAIAWRLPVPPWLAFAVAALVLIGFTGAMASQILDRGGSSPPSGTMAETLHGYGFEAKTFNGSFMSDYRFSARQSEAGKEVNQLAEESRERVLSQLDKETEKTARRRDPGKYSPETKKETLGPPSDGTSNTITYDEKPRQEPSNKPLPPSGGRGPTDGMGMGDGKFPSFPPGYGSGMMGIGGMGGMMGMMGGPQPGWSPDGRKSLTSGPPEGYFDPSKAFKQQPAEKGKDQKGGENKGDNNEGGKSKENEGKGESKKPSKDGQAQGQGGQDKNKPGGQKPPQPRAQAGPRKIVIRTGEVEYEVQSFDAAVATITRLIKPIKGGFVATVSSDKLANGKVRGAVVVRVPPENLDELILDLRVNLGKSGELKNQRITSLDVSKQYTDLESRLKAARAMEERLLQIIKNGKGEIKDLLAVEKELGEWRERIEKIEGELRYYANQVALSTLTINLYEKEIAAPFGVVEREQVEMGVEVEDVDKAFQAAQKAVREAKGRITHSKLNQPSEGQYSAELHFEVPPDAAGPLRDRFKQLGTVARLDVSRQEESEGGSGKPSDGKVRRDDTRFRVNFYNLTNVAPRETVRINLACVDVEASLKTLLARIEKAAGRIVSSNLNTARGDQAQADLQFEVKSTDADAVLEDVKAAGEVMRLNVTESTNVQGTTRKKRGFHVQLLALSAATARETDALQLACADVAASYRAVQDAVLKAKGRVRNAQLNEEDRRKVTATLDFEVRRADEDAVRAVLATAGDVYVRKVSRAADADNVVDSKVYWQVKFLNQADIPPRETYVFAVEVSDVDQTAAMLSALAGKTRARTVEANVARERTGRVTGKLIYDVPMTEVHELLDALKSAGTVRVQQSMKHPEIPDSPLAVARLEITLSNKELIVPSDGGFGSNVHRGLSDSFAVLSWSLRILILGLCVILPWALVIWGIYRLVPRLRRRTTPATPAA